MAGVRWKALLYLIISAFCITLVVWLCLDERAPQHLTGEPEKDYPSPSLSVYSNTLRGESLTEEISATTTALRASGELELLEEVDISSEEFDKILTRLGLTREEAWAEAERHNITREEYLQLPILNYDFAH